MSKRQGPWEIAWDLRYLRLDISQPPARRQTSEGDQAQKTECDVSAFQNGPIPFRRTDQPLPRFGPSRHTHGAAHLFDRVSIGASTDTTLSSR